MSQASKASKEHQGIGFLGDPHRLNVALTRAKYGLIIVGDARLLATQPLWNHLLHHFADWGQLVDGPISRLHPSTVELPRLTIVTRLHNPLEAQSRLMSGVEHHRHLPNHLAQALQTSIPEKRVLKPDATYQCGSCGKSAAVIEPDGSCPNYYAHDVRMSPREASCSSQRVPDYIGKQLEVKNQKRQSAASRGHVRDATVQTNAPQTPTESLSGTRCVVCCDKQMCVLFRPCKHISLCEDCIGLTNCPVCKAAVTTFEKVFLVGTV